MEENKTAAPNKKSVAGKIFRIIYKTVLIIILVVSAIALLILTPPVQNLIRKKATTWLTEKLDTRVELGRIYLGFPKKVVLENIYVEDRQKDTLLSAGAIKVDVSMLKLLSNELEINDVQLTAITAKVSRVLPDTIYNFQFIIDAFDTGETKPETTDSSSMKISVRDVALDKIRLVYKDDVTGNDVALWLEHFDIHMDEFDLDNMRFDIPETNIRGIIASVYQHKPLIEPQDLAEDSIEDRQPASPAPDVRFTRINLDDIRFDYGNDVSALFANLNLGKLAVNAEEVNMAQKTIILDRIALENTTAGIRMGKTQTTELVEEKTAQEAEEAKEEGWRFLVKDIQINNNNLAFSDDNKPRLASGMDFAHLEAKSLTLQAENFLFSPDSIGATITRGEFSERSGFTLNTLETEFLYAHNEAYLRNLLLETPGTTLRRSAAIRYPSMEALQKDLGSMELDLRLTDSKIQVKDILSFVPDLAAQPAFSNPSMTLFLDGDIRGKVAEMDIRQLSLRAFSNTSVNVRGTISGLPDTDRLRGNLVIASIRTGNKDIRLLAPKGSVPTTITIPENISLRGNISGSMADARANLRLDTELGNASLNGSIRNATNKNNAAYQASFSTQSLQLGTIMQNDSMLGPLSAEISASGKGFDVKTASADLKGHISSVVLNQYEYKDIALNGKLAGQKADLALGIKDPNLNISLTGKGNLAGEFPAATLNLTINTVNPRALHFTTDTLMYSGVIEADFPVLDPAGPTGNLLITRSKLLSGTTQFDLDTIALNSGKNEKGKFIQLNSDDINLNLAGEYNLAQLGQVFQDAIQPYFSTTAPDSAAGTGTPTSGIAAASKADTLDRYDFDITGTIVHGPLIKTFVPALERLEPVQLNAHFETDADWNTTIDAPLVIMGTNRIQQLQVKAGTARDAIRVNTSLEQFSLGSSMIIYQSNLDASIANNQINFLLNLKDLDKKNKYRLGGHLHQPEPGTYSLALHPDSLLLNYDKWVLPADNLVKMVGNDIHVTNLSLSRNDQQLRINSTAPYPNAPVEVTFSGFRIGTITAFAKQDSLLADGVINGQVVVKDIPERMTFTSDLTVTDLMFMTDTVGNLALKVNSTTPNVFDADISLTGKGNDIAITGNYQLKPENQGLADLNIAIRQLQMASVEALSMGAIDQGTGFISGGFDIDGSLDDPAIQGELVFNKTGFSPAMLGGFFMINDDRVSVDNKGIHFNSFTILDSAKNELVLDGDALTTNFMNYTLNLDLIAENFQALNNTKQDNKLFYGQFYFDTDLQIRGTEKSPSIDGLISINENTKFTVVMPQGDPGVVEREGIVRFVDMDSIQTNSLVELSAYDSLGNSELTGMNISVNIEIVKEAELTLIIDEGNGDFVTMKGTAQLTGGIDPSGKTTLAGTYEIDEGAYEMSINFLQRRFEIQQGSKITWLGEPTKANVELTAVYEANTAPLSLVENQIDVPNLNMYKQKLPFQVLLILNGELMKPEISFDLTLPEEQETYVDAAVIENVETRLSQLKSEPSELNKQVFALLLLNRFVAENPFASSGGGGGLGTMARQSVSKLLAEQLNSLAADLVSGVDLNFDLASTEDYTTGKMENRTDLNVSLSKQLLNDRLRVTVGSNFELEGPQHAKQQETNLAGNVALDYMLSKDGRYMIRAYRKNEYEGELEGYIIETGLNFIMTFNYDRLRELFHSPKDKSIRRKNRERKRKEQQESATETTKSTQQPPATND